MQISERFINRYNTGDSVFTEGEAGRDMFIVVAGRVGVFKQGAHGEEETVAELVTGQIFGEMALVEALPRSASVRALVDGTELIKIDQPRFVYLVSHQPAFALSVMQSISQRLRNSLGTDAPIQLAKNPEPRRPDSGKKELVVNELHPGIFQFVLPQRGCHVYLLKGRSKNVLIDTGLPQTAPYVEECLQSVGLSSRDIHLVALTHEHVDHAGGAAYLGQHAMIAAHRLAANKVASQDEFVLMNQAFGVEVGDFCVDLQLEHGNIINLGNFELQVIHTPGHTSGGICFYEPNARLLFCGDMVFAGGIMGGVFGSGNISDYIASLKVMRNLRIDQMLPGHGQICTQPYDDLDGAIRLAETLMTDTKAFLGALNMRSSFDQVLRAAFGLKG